MTVSTRPHPAGFASSALVALRLLALAASVGLVCGLKVEPAIGQVGNQPAFFTLLRYRLPASEVPQNYAIYDQTATPNVSVAFGYSTDERTDALQYLLSSGRIAGLQQTFVAASPGTSVVVHLSLALYRDTSAAAAALTSTEPPGLAGEPTSVAPPPIGDDARALSGTLADDGADPEDAVFEVAWRHGQLFFAATARSDDADAAQAASLSFGNAADAHAAEIGYPVLTKFDADASSSQQLDLDSALEKRQLDSSAVPEKFARTGEYIWSNDQIALDSADLPRTTNDYASSNGRITAMVEYFTTHDSARLVLSSVYAIYNEAAAAQAAVDDLGVGTSPQAAVLRLTPASQLGDATSLYVATARWPRGDLRNSYALQWSHGSVLLSVVLNQPAAQEFPAYLYDVAARLDKTYTSAPLGQVSGN